MLNLLKKTKNLYYNIFNDILISKKDREILYSPENSEFKAVLLKYIDSKMQENLDLLIHKGTKSDEERGKYMGVILVYEDLKEAFSKPKEKKKEEYIDPIRAIEKKIEEEN